MEIILGSQSPRRRDILNFFTLPFEQMASHFDEDSISFEGDPLNYANQLSQAKGEVLSHRFPNKVILTADSVVFLNGKIYNKPKDLEEAAQFLRELGGRWHTVHTAVCVRKGSDTFSDSETTRLLMYRLTEEQIRKFHQHVHALDKAGGFAIEGCGQLIFERMEGCYYNVLGLPINATRRVLMKIGIDLWDYLGEMR